MIKKKQLSKGIKPSPHSQTAKLFGAQKDNLIVMIIFVFDLS